MASERSGDGAHREIPPVAVSYTSTLVHRTGSWKYVRPVYQDRVAPCNEACPVGIDIEGYLNLLREGRITEACDLLLRENPMPAVTGRVCHHPCETRCNRGSFDESVSIHSIERALGDLSFEEGLPEPRARSSRVQRVAVVGSGPAGLACAYHLARLGYPVMVFEADDRPGGMLRQGIPSYRLPRTILDREIERIRSQGVEIRCGVRVGSDLAWSDLEAFAAVFVATGAHRNRPLGVEGEAIRGVRSGLDFLKAVNRGERPDVGRRVVVVGGGNTAMDCARTALRLGAEVTILYRRTRAEMPAIDQEIEEAEREGVRFIFLAAPAAFRGRRGRLRQVVCTRMRLGPPDASGRRRPVPIDSDPFMLRADTVLMAIGEQADLEALPDAVERQDAAVKVDALGATSRPAVFSGGDVAGEERTVAHALGSGKRAAIGIDRYLRGLVTDSMGALDVDALRYGVRGNVSMTRWTGDDPIERADPINEVVEFEDLNASHFIHLSRNAERHLSPQDSRAGFSEVNLGLEPETLLDEARRCFNCAVCNQCELCLIFCPDLAISRSGDGRGFEIDYDYCKGCGVCVTECPRGAMVMTRGGL